MVVAMTVCDSGRGMLIWQVVSLQCRGGQWDGELEMLSHSTSRQLQGIFLILVKLPYLF
ncbi:hypothetical protein COLO4_30190 [Corchorus olitorius]|uniref:Uncharacterized protein n=1 Tax=Corchorus olitorius TaxID=93759 RepID=A0A1R3HAF7_9ROSI|nr:hypothetical protein COLO4_30190 [Corchorus olitorius]